MRRAHDSLSRSRKTRAGTRDLGHLASKASPLVALELGIRAARRDLDVEAQHGPVKVLVKNGVRLESPETISSSKGARA